MDKGAVMGGGIFMIYRLLLLSLIAFMILGASSIFYGHYIDVRDAEARIMGRSIMECLYGDAIIDLNVLEGFDSAGNSLFSYCGFSEKEVDRFFIKLVIQDSFNKELFSYSFGDSKSPFVRDFLLRVDSEAVEIGKYEPGYFGDIYFVNILTPQGDELNGKLGLEVYVSDEF